MFKEAYNKRIIHFYILIWILIVLIFIVGFIMVRYFVKGETKMPFEISKILVVSSAQTTNVELLENTYSANVIQKNDFHISLEKNNKSKKEDFIKEIVFENFKVLESSNIGTVEIYRPSKDAKLFTYKEEYKQNNITYIGTQETNVKGEILEIANQGGVINFSIVLDNVGKISYTEDENINLDGRLLNKLEIPYEKIKYKISFDVKIKVESGNTFYTKIEIELPVGNILEEGVVSEEYKGITNLVFKRK